MITKELTEREFRESFDMLVRRFGATVELEPDTRMIVSIPTTYDTYGNIRRQGCTIDLGK